jgi:hypothetical protein
MLPTMDERIRVVDPLVPGSAHDPPACILAALIDGLTSPERYSLEMRDAELHIVHARGGGEPRSAPLAEPGQCAATGLSGC